MRQTLFTLTLVLFLFQIGLAKAKSSPSDSEKMVEAIQKQDLKTVNSFKKKGISLNAVGADGLTGLMRLSDNGNEEGVKTILSLGAELDYANQDGETALFYATYSGHEDLALQLLKRGAKADRILPKNKECVIHSAAKASLSKLALELKKTAPSCLKQKNFEGKTPSDIAKEMGATDLAKSLKP